MGCTFAHGQDLLEIDWNLISIDKNHASGMDHFAYLNSEVFLFYFLLIFNILPLINYFHFLGGEEEEAYKRRGAGKKASIHKEL